MKTKITTQEYTELRTIFNNYFPPALFKVEQGRFTASLNDNAIIDVEAKTLIDDDGTTSQLVWYIEIKAVPRFISTEAKCICPPTDTIHTPPCIYYAPSPQEIYKESLR